MPACRWFVRFVVLGTAACAIVWSVAAGLAYPNNSSKLNTIATRIMAGDAFASSTPLASELEQAELREPCNALEARSATIIRLRMYEDAVSQSDVRAANERMKALQFSVKRSLDCVPTDAFLWFIRYWLLITQGNAASDQLDNLAMSYRLGPNEGWIALRRNVFALAVYDLLPAHVQKDVRSEFASLVDSGFLKQAAHNLQGPGWPLRDVLLPELARTRLAVRQYLYRMLRAENIDVEIPGVERRENLMWR
jgi:hypothetical protein